MHAKRYHIVMEIGFGSTASEKGGVPPKNPKQSYGKILLWKDATSVPPLRIESGSCRENYFESAARCVASAAYFLHLSCIAPDVCAQRLKASAASL